MFRSKILCLAIVATLTLPPQASFAEDQEYLDTVREAAEYNVQQYRWMRKALDILTFCTSNCQVEREMKKYIERQNRNYGSLGIRG